MAKAKIQEREVITMKIYFDKEKSAEVISGLVHNTVDISKKAEDILTTHIPNMWLLIIKKLCPVNHGICWNAIVLSQKRKITSQNKYNVENYYFGWRKCRNQ